MPGSMRELLTCPAWHAKPPTSYWGTHIPLLTPKIPTPASRWTPMCIGWPTAWDWRQPKPCEDRTGSDGSGAAQELVSIHSSSNRTRPRHLYRQKAALGECRLADICPRPGLRAEGGSVAAARYDLPTTSGIAAQTPLSTATLAHCPIGEPLPDTLCTYRWSHQCKRLPEERSVNVDDIKTIGVCGAGTMGADCAVGRPERFQCQGDRCRKPSSNVG